MKKIFCLYAYLKIFILDLYIYIYIRRDESEPRKFKYTIIVNVNKIISASINSSCHRLIGPVGRVFANDPGDLGSIPGRVMPKTLKIVLDTSLLNTQQYKVRYVSRVKWTNPGKGVAPFPTHRCCSYGKGILVALDYDHQLYFLLLYINNVCMMHIYIYVCVCVCVRVCVCGEREREREREREKESIKGEKDERRENC